MGFNLSAFGAGFAKSAAEDMQYERKLTGAEAVKNLYNNYKNVIEENKTKETDLLSNIELLRTYDPTATESELYALSTKPAVMNQITSLIKDKQFDPSSFKISNFAKVAEDNVTSTAIERVKALSVIPMLAKQTAMEEFKPSGNILRDLLDKSSARVKEKTMLDQAQVAGISLDRLRSAQNFVRPTDQVDAVFDMSKLRPEKTFAEQEDIAKIKLLKANNANDPVASRLAQADLLVVKTIKDSMSGEQTVFANKVAELKNKAAFGNPDEKVKAIKELDSWFEIERREAEAKKVRGDDSEGKVPNLSTLNTFTSAAVGRALAGKYGDLVKSKQLAIIEKPDGSTGFSYVGTDAAVRKGINDLQASAARSALSLYTDSAGRPANRDVASVLNSFNISTPSEAPAPAVAPAVPALPRATNLSSAPAGRNPAPATAPVIDVATERRVANAAIAKGADEAAVKARFKQTTGQDL